MGRQVQRRGITGRKWVLVAVLAFPTALLGWVAWMFITPFFGDPMPQAEAVPCKEAMHYADQDGLPRGAHDAKCTVLAWLDTNYKVRFTITRTDLDAWLKKAYPGTRLTSEDCLGAPVDACAHIELDPPADGGAMAIDISVRYGKGSTAVVDFEPFDV
jgi:hypothetical protein